ncbi:hypothetical protein [Spirosoma validum]|uniref:PH domain-containing protein n=1 Tax=Spirosoma validum TaxID=2771355 RepID=A0A927GCA0_9BACT|nr:hypothetical protein [Spirosoma validum]MBD2752305.1 hypothetical protein [Spirosoma validum]
MDTFTESQRFRQGWVWIILGFITLILVGSLYAADTWNDPMLLIEFIPPLLISLLLYSWRLDTRLDSEGIHYRIFPILSWRTISWNTVQSVSVSEYSFVGYGIRWGFAGWVYNIAGNKGLRIIRPNGRQITIGTQRPDELQHFLDRQYVQLS